MNHSERISQSIEKLEANLFQTARVEDWAELMGYECPKDFAHQFMQYYSIRPVHILKFIRLKSITEKLRKNNTSNFEIARQYGIPNEIALNKFINYHIGCSPTEVKKMHDDQLAKKLKKIGSKIR